MNRIRSTILLALSGLSACVDGLFAPDRAPSELRLDPEEYIAVQGEAVDVGVAVLDQYGEAFGRLPRFATETWSVSDPKVVEWDGDFLNALEPGRASARVDLAGLQATLPFMVNPTELRLEIDGVYLTQGPQRYDGSVPLVSGRDAYLRVFLRGNVISFFDPVVRVVLRDAVGTEDMLTVSAVEPSIPTSVDEGRLPGSWTVRLPGERIRPGMALRVEADPSGVVPLAPESRTEWPRSGEWVELDVRELPTFEARMVPVRIAETDRTGNVDEASATDFLDLALRVFPIADYDIDVRSTFTSAYRPATNEGWLGILQEIRMLRVADGSSRYYYGVVVREGAVQGIGYIGAPAAVGLDSHDPVLNGFTTVGASTYAHEIGHNFGRRHAPCGDAPGPDGSFPYPGGISGVAGFDLADSVPRSRELPDLMGYCAPRWVSDYTYDAVLDFRMAEGADPSSRSGAPNGPGRVLLVWGAITDDGVQMQPSFELSARPRLPARSGPHVLEGLDETGARVFRLSFEATEVAEAGAAVRHFAFAVPLEMAQPDRLAALRLTSGPYSVRVASPRGGGGEARSGESIDAVRPTVRLNAGRRVELRWDADEYPAALVTDPYTGAVVGHARGGSATLVTGAAELDVHLSDGVRSDVFRVRVSTR